MPFASKRQQRWAHGTHQPFARRWDKETTFAGLPERKDAASDDGAAAHGPGGLLATPGLGARAVLSQSKGRRRKGRKWGMRTKAKQIIGNLYRGDTGQFQAGGSGGATPTPKRGITLSKQPIKPPRRGGSPAKKPAGPKPKDPAVVARQAQRDQERAEDRATRAADRAARVARQAQRDRDKIAKDMERTAAEAKKKLEAKQPKAGGGGGSKKPSDADKKQQQTQERAKRADATAAQVGMGAADLSALRSASETGGVANAALTQLGLVGSDGLATDQGRRALSALERGDVRGYNAALQDAKSRIGRETGARDRKAQAEAKRTTAASERQAKQQRQIERLRRRAQGGGKLSSAQIDQAMESGAMDASGRWKSFMVFKDARGQQRWVARTTTAYRDRDQEIISSAALDADSVRMTTTKQFGPLRYWHVGQPDPFRVDAPWGPGLDIGDCDYSTLIGRTRIESGTFRDPQIAQTIAAQADSYELSPGFFHPLDQPDSDGVFNAIRTFERSIVPVARGRASNLFTGLAVKETRMDIGEMERRFKAAITDLGLDAAQAQQLGAQLVQTEKDATAQGIAFKSEDAPAAPASPDDITINGVVYTIKAAPPPSMDALEMDALTPDEAVAEVGIEEPGEEMDGDYLGDMSWDDFAAKLSELLAPVLKMQDMMKQMGDMHGELKTMYGGVAQKDDYQAAELVSLKASLAELTQKIADIEGDQPAVILADDVAEALKSAGPSVPAAPATKPIESTPERPWAGWGAKTFPELYQNGEPT